MRINRVLIVVLLIFGIFVIVYCNTYISGIRLSEIKHGDIDSIDGFSMSIINKSRSRITLLFDNNTNTSYEYGSKFYLEKYVNDTWYCLIPNDTFITMESYKIEAYEKQEIEKKLIGTYGLLRKGDYRVVKEFYVQDENGQLRTYILAAYFQIGKR